MLNPILEMKQLSWLQTELLSRSSAAPCWETALHSGQTPRLLHRTACRLTWHILKSYSNPELWIWTLLPLVFRKGLHEWYFSAWFPFTGSCCNQQATISVILLSRVYEPAGLLTDRKQDCRSFHSVCSTMRYSLHPSPHEVNEWLRHGFNPAWHNWECNVECYI